MAAIEPQSSVVAPQTKKPLWKRWWFWVVAFLLVLFVITGLSSGGGSSSSDSTPEVTPVMLDLVGERLDIAISEMETIEVSESDIEIVGGGALGILDESNWFVCEQRPDAGSSDFAAVRFIVDRSCTALTSSESSVSPTPTAEELPAAEVSPSVESTPSESETPSSPVVFLAENRRDLRDLNKDLNDLVKALNEGGTFRILGNLIEIEFNLAQLNGSAPPVSVGPEWANALADIADSVDKLSTAITDDGTPNQVRNAVASIKSGIKNANAYLKSYESSLEE